MRHARTRLLAVTLALAPFAFGAPAALACDGDHAAAAKTDEKVPEGASTVAYTVEGMTCDGCSSKVTAAIKKLKGVYTVSVDLSTKTAKVAFDPAKVKPEQIKAAIVKAGYKPASVA